MKLDVEYRKENGKENKMEETFAICIMVSNIIHAN